MRPQISIPAVVVLLFTCDSAEAQPPPVLNSLTPSSALVGTTLDITVEGQDFLDGATLDLGSRTTTNSTTFIDSNTLVANVTIQSIADAGLRDAKVENPDLQISVLQDGFEYIPTPRHFVSPLGSNVFPYTTRLTAAHSLFEVLTAAGNGDSILVSSGTWSEPSTRVERSVDISGAWNANFTSRDVANAKTVLQLSSNLVIDDPPFEHSPFPSYEFPTVSMDGFVFEGGTGAQSTSNSPRVAGAVDVDGSSLTASNCVFRYNSAVSVEPDDKGGALRIVDNGVEPTVVNILSCEFYGNESDYGAAIYLAAGRYSRMLEALIMNSSFTNNTGARFGGAIYAHGGDQLTLQDNVFDGHVASSSGGTIWARYQTGMQVVGGSISNSDAAIDGGAIYTLESELTVEGVAFQNCSAAEDGGALALNLNLSAQIRESMFDACEALIGGVVGVDGGTVDVSHNLFSNNTGIYPAAWIRYVAGGVVLGNTVANNPAPGPAFQFFDAPIGGSNNIIANNVGIGISCGGASLPVLSYNNVFANGGGAHLGCVAGVGSISMDPLFVNPAGGDYHLGAHSPSIDAGDPSLALADPDGGRGDMGWYGSHPFVTEVPSTPQSVTVRVVGSDIVIDWSANPEPDVTQYLVYGSPVAEFVPSAGLLRATVAAPATSANLGPANGDQYFKLGAVDGHGYSSGFAVAEEAVPVLPGSPTFATGLVTAVPNPFNPRTLIRFELAARGPARLRVYDLSGRLVRRLLDEELDAGVHEQPWNGRDEAGRAVASGVYFCRLESSAGYSTTKLMLLK